MPQFLETFATFTVTNVGSIRVFHNLCRGWPSGDSGAVMARVRGGSFLDERGPRSRAMSPFHVSLLAGRPRSSSHSADVSRRWAIVPISSRIRHSLSFKSKICAAHSFFSPPCAEPHVESPLRGGNVCRSETGLVPCRSGGRVTNDLRGIGISISPYETESPASSLGHHGSSSCRRSLTETKCDWSQ